MSNGIELRPYQREAVDVLHEGFEKGLKSQAVVSATGTGKTITFSAFISERDKNVGGQHVVLAHTEELINQAVEKLNWAFPHLEVGRVDATHKETDAQVVVGTVQAMSQPGRAESIKNVQTVVIDECHHGTTQSYETVLNAHPEAKVAGFTATYMRSDAKKLSSVFQRVASKYGIVQAIRDGYLRDVYGKRAVVDDLDISDIGTRGGDLAEGDLGRAINASSAPRIAAESYIEHAGDRTGVNFVPLVESAYLFSEAFNDHGIPSAVIHGGLSDDERKEVITGLWSGKYQVVHNARLLTEGFDCPKVSCVVISRNTLSPGLYQQMAGRGLRPDLSDPVNGRRKALLLDIVGASSMHSLAGMVDLSEERILPKGEASLMEAVLDEDLREECEYPEELISYKDVLIKDFDPLIGKMKQRWNRSEAGAYFVSIGTDRDSAVYVFLAPTRHPGLYDVMWACKHYKATFEGRGGDRTEHQGLPLEMALAWGAVVAERFMELPGAQTTTKKNSSWQYRKASEAQRRMARTLKLDVPEMARAGEVSLAIDQRIASNRLDPIVEHYQRRG